MSYAMADELTGPSPRLARSHVYGSRVVTLLGMSSKAHADLHGGHLDDARLLACRSVDLGRQPVHQSRTTLARSSVSSIDPGRCCGRNVSSKVLHPSQASPTAELTR